MNKEILSTIVILSSVIVLITVVLCLYTDSEIKRLNNEVTQTQLNEITMLSSRFDLRLRHLSGVLELAAQTTPIASPPVDSDLISEQLKGIPEDADIEKRKTAKILLDKEFALDYVFYAMPNGDIYFLEPFDSQIKLPQSNFAFRDWYNGVITTGSTYVSEVYVSANEKHNVIGIGVPIYSDVEPTILNGIFVGALHLGELQKSLATLSLGQNEYLVIIDHNNNIVADSRNLNSDVEIRKFDVRLDVSIHDTEAHMITKTIDGKDVVMTFKPIRAGTHDWLFASIQPYGDAFASSTLLRNEAILIIIILVIIVTLLGFFLIRKINANLVLTSGLQRIDVEKEQFAAMVTHELKTPLVPVIGYCKMLRTSLLGNLTSQQADALDVIEKNAKRLERLISDIMDVRKLDLNRIKFSMADVLIDEFFDDLNTSYAQVLSQSGKEFIIDIQRKGLRMQTDRNRLRQCFDNLISNAIKFTPAIGAKITVGCRVDGGKLILFVRDNGMGISEDAQKFLFKKFYQIDTSERRNIGGSGLGLAICKGIIECLGGKIWVESDGKTGSTFYMAFKCWI